MPPYPHSTAVKYCITSAHITLKLIICIGVFNSATKISINTVHLELAAFHPSMNTEGNTHFPTTVSLSCQTLKTLAAIILKQGNSGADRKSPPLWSCVASSGRLYSPKHSACSSCTKGALLSSACCSDPAFPEDCGQN